MEASPKWKYKIKLKHLFEQEDVTAEGTLAVCTQAVAELKKVLTKVEVSNLTENEIYDVTNELENLISNFEFLGELASGEIAEDEWENYSFDGDFEQWGNDYLNELYDLADRRVATTAGFTEKFMWVD